MELFSEIYSAYFTAIRRMLEASKFKKLSEAETADIINKTAFADSAFFILPNLRSGEWNFSGITPDRFSLPLSNLQKAWLKALLGDKRMKLFLDADEAEALGLLLKDTEPLFDIRDFHFFDSSLCGDPFEDEEYIKNFRLILSAVKEGRTVKIGYESFKGKRTLHDYLPIKMNYSRRDDKFRLLAVMQRRNKPKNVTLNLSRITRVLDSNKIIDPGTERREKPSVVLQIKNERNAVARVMTQFAWAEKETEYNAETGECTCRIFYDRQEETDLLIQILSFGPVIKVQGPEDFLALIRQRVRMQAELLAR